MIRNVPVVRHVFIGWWWDVCGCSILYTLKFVTCVILIKKRFKLWITLRFSISMIPSIIYRKDLFRKLTYIPSLCSLETDMNEEVIEWCLWCAILNFLLETDCPMAPSVLTLIKLFCSASSSSEWHPFPIMSCTCAKILPPACYRFLNLIDSIRLCYLSQSVWICVHTLISSLSSLSWTIFCYSCWYHGLILVISLTGK